MSKNYTFTIENNIYNVNIKNHIMKIYNHINQQIGKDIEIADHYAKEENVVKALVEMEIDSIKDKEENKNLIDDALKQLGIIQ